MRRIFSGGLAGVLLAAQACGASDGNPSATGNGAGSSDRGRDAATASSASAPFGSGDSGSTAVSSGPSSPSGPNATDSGASPAGMTDSDASAEASNAPAEDGGSASSDGGALADETGASSSSSSSSASNADSGIAGCAAVPVNPNATPQARRLLCYLYQQYGHHVLSGQQETSWASNPDVDTDYVHTNTGKYPAVRGFDFLYTNGTTARAQAWWNAGGIPLLCYHMGAPPQSDTYAYSMTAAGGGINAVLTPGTASYTSFIQKLDYAAGELQKLQAANVAVLWRPFHEAGGSWFWWSKESGAQYVRLWTFMYDYFTHTKGLNNLVWLHPYNGSPLASFYPGKTYVDVGGADTYGSNQPFASMFGSTRGIVGTSIPIALHENGQMPNPANMFAGGAAPWVLFNTWAGYETSANTVAYLQSVYANASTVTRDQVPSLK